MPGTVASPPDAAVIAKIANELFVALSGNPVPPAGAHTSAWPPVSAPGGSEVSVPAKPQGAGLLPPTETDPRTLPASPMGAAAVVPANPAAVPTQGVPGSPATAFDGARAPFLNASPVFPATRELFSLPNVPGAQSPPGLPSLPSAKSPTQPTEAELRALPASLGDATPLVPEPSGSEAAGAAPGSSPYFLDGHSGKAAPFNAAPFFPATSDIFNLPGVPGLQSFPGNPALPSSPDIASPSQADLRAILASLPGATAAATVIPDTVSSPPAVPGCAVLLRRRRESRTSGRDAVARVPA